MEVQMAKELIEANQILVRLRKIQRIRSEILELKQSTVAEIRSYQNPPPVVHTVMTATFLILGHKESDTKVGEHGHNENGLFNPRNDWADWNLGRCLGFDLLVHHES